MSFFGSLAQTTARKIHDGAIKTLASWDPDTVGESQLTEWSNKAQELATMAATAIVDRDKARARLTQLQSDAARYAAAAEKLAESNPTAAEKAADQAIELQSQIEEAKAILADAETWATETRTSAENAQEKVAKGRTAIEAAKREQNRARQEQTVAEQRLKDRERLAGITTGLDGADIAIDALRSNAEDAKKKATAANIRSGALSKGADADAAVKEALAEVDGKGKPKSLADKLAAIKSVGA